MKTRFPASIILFLILWGCQHQATEPAWISAVSRYDSIPPLRPAPYFRKEFVLDEPVASAKLRISGLGYFHAYINGNKVGDHHLDPAVTMYHKRVKYVEFDVSNMLDQGGNAIGAVLGNGFYNQHTRSVWDFETAPWRDSPSLYALLSVQLESGSEVYVVSDESWKVGQGPIRFDGIRNGEHHDARYDISGWSEPGFDATDWAEASRVNDPEGFLSEQVMPPIRAVSVLQAESIRDMGHGSYLLDFGQNISGWGKIRVEAEEGTEIVLRYGEVLGEDGMLDTRELSRFIRSGETQTDRYICSGNGLETWEPSFIYHGFQYIEVTGLSEPPGDHTITAVVAYTDLERTGSFRCSDSVLNQLQDNIIWSFLTNYHSYPEDCPHREKMGWSGDAQLLAEMALYNFNMRSSYLKWLDDFTDAQLENGQLPGIVPTSGWGFTYGRDSLYRDRGYGPQWEGAFVEIAWQLFSFTGDTSILTRYYPELKKYVDYLEAYSEGNLLYFGIDDHKALPPVTQPPILASGHYFRCVEIMVNITEILDYGDDHQKFNNLSRQISHAFREKYIDPLTFKVGTGSQTEQAMALYFDLVPELSREGVYSRLKESLSKTNWHLHTGVLGTKYMINVLPGFGDQDLLYRMITSPVYPGFGYWITQGANTMWQTWDGKMSRNHIMFGSLGEWFYKYVAGITPDENKPGFNHFFLQPDVPDELSDFDCKFQTGNGEILMKYEQIGNNREFLISIPSGTNGTLVLECRDRPAIENQQSGKKLYMNSDHPGHYSIMLDPGRYKVLSVQSCKKKNHI